MENRGQDAVSPVGTVLIVDDTEASAAALELACAAIPGISVSTVSSALEAVRILREQDRPVRAVLTDIQMPHMNGFDLIRFIRADQRLAKTPIIVVTADTDPSTPELTALLGANAYFSKPFSPRAVRETLERLLYENPSAE
jgi:CheY-like chemotaxis protein